MTILPARNALDSLGVSHRPHPVRIGSLVSATSAVAPMTGDDPVVATYLRYLEHGPDAVAGAVAEMVRPGSTPVLVHCTVGKDRTGVVIALALAAVGVQRNDIVAEYARLADDVGVSMERLRGMVSYGAAVDLYPRAAFAVEPDTIHRFLEAVDRLHDGPRAFLLAHGFTPQMLEELEELLVEHPHARQLDEEPTMKNITETKTYAAGPAEVWKVVGDTGAVATWVPAIESSHLEGDVRHATFAGGGGDATERIVEKDDAGRSYVYEYLTGPLPLQEYRSRISVREHSQGSEVVWVSDFTSGSADTDEELAQAISGIYRGALDQLESILTPGE